MAAIQPDPVSEPSQQVKLRRIVKADDHSSWDEAWKQNVTPWNVGEIQPALREALANSTLNLPRSGRAFVPGCGSGYDVVYIASILGLDSIGLDGSETANERAKQLLNAQENPPANVTFLVGDFFKFSVSDEERFDLIYDYTFFVAIPPSQRNDWGRQMRSLIKPGGYLITLVYPIDPPPAEIGPPYFVRPEHYIEPLGDGWVKVLDKIPDVSLPSHVDRERLVVWKRSAV